MVLLVLLVMVVLGCLGCGIGVVGVYSLSHCPARCRQAGLSVGFGTYGVTCEWAGCKAVQQNMTQPELYGWNPADTSCERDLRTGINDGHR